jgi:hypothetical protein
MRAMKKSNVNDSALVDAVDELAQGLHEGDLGGGVFKKRIALPGQGKRGSLRTILATKAGTRWFYLFGFKKNERSNISEQELEALKALAEDLFTLDAKDLQTALRDGALTEIEHGGR